MISPDLQIHVGNRALGPDPEQRDSCKQPAFPIRPLVKADPLVTPVPLANANREGLVEEELRLADRAALVSGFFGSKIRDHLPQHLSYITLNRYDVCPSQRLLSVK